MQLVVVVSSFNLALAFIGHIFSLLIVYFSIITLNKGNVGTNHLNNRILLFVCNRKVIYYYYITLPSITITITFGNFQSITITGKSGYYILQLHITITPSLLACVFKISAVGPYFLLFDYQEAFHCCLAVACINRINMISIQCHRVGQW